MKKERYPLIGAILMAASAITVADYAVRKTKKKAVSAAILFTGMAGLVIGTAMVLQPEAENIKKLAIDDMMTDEDVALVNSNIYEVLSNGVERPASHEKLRTIEIDEETSIEDFIF